MDDTIPTQMHASAVIASHHLRKSAPCQIVQEALNNHTNGPNPPKYEIMRIVTLKVDRKITPPGGVIQNPGVGLTATNLPPCTNFFYGTGGQIRRS